jgi:hypothetical protein
MEPFKVALERERALERPERWLCKRDLADHLGFGIRWVEYRMLEGMPHKRIGGRARFQLSSVETWLAQHEPPRRAA